MLRSEIAPLAFLFCSAIAFDAHAQSQDVVALRAGINTIAYDNFLNATSASAVSERLISQSIGVNVTVPYSLQSFELDASLNSNQHQYLTNFDYVGQNYSAAWRWALTPRFRGSLTTGRTEALNAPSDNATANLRNKNTTLNSALTALYDLGGAWQFSSGLNSTDTSNERPLLGQLNQTNTNASGYNLGLVYTPSPGNTVTYSFQNSTGSSSTGFKLLTHQVALTWVPTGNTSVNARLSHLEQSFSVSKQYDFSGVQGGIAATWRPSGKTSIALGWQRALASFQTAGTTNTITDTFNIGPSWQISAKTALRLQWSQSNRDDQGNPFGTPSSRRDTLNNTTLSLEWLPRLNATLAISATEARRSSNLANADFASTQLALGAQFRF